MNLEIAYLLFLIVVALVMFATEVLSIDIVGLLLLLALTVPGILSPAQALAGFGIEGPDRPLLHGTGEPRAIPDGAGTDQDEEHALREQNLLRFRRPLEF